MRNAAYERDSTAPRASDWRELFRSDDLRLARAVATSIAAMEFDVRLRSAAHAVESGDDDAAGDTIAAVDLSEPRFSPHGATAFQHAACPCTDDCVVGPHVIDVPADAWLSLHGILSEIIDEQREFDQMLEERRERNRTTLVVVLSITAAAEVVLIWRLLDA